MANNYGILKAGDGGNGGRGLDGEGGSDTTKSTNAPTHGAFGGNGGELGAGGTITNLTAEKEHNNFNKDGENLKSGTNGAIGPHGNDGWGGLNLVRYEYSRGREKLLKRQKDSYPYNIHTLTINQNGQCTDSNGFASSDVLKIMLCSAGEQEGYYNTADIEWKSEAGESYIALNLNLKTKDDTLNQEINTTFEKDKIIAKVYFHYRVNLSDTVHTSSNKPNTCIEIYTAAWMTSAKCYNAQNQILE